MKTFKNIAAVLAIGLITVSIVRNNLNLADNHPFLMFGVGLLLVVVVPFHLITTARQNMSDDYIENTGNQHVYQNRPV